MILNALNAPGKVPTWSSILLDKAKHIGKFTSQPTLTVKSKVKATDQTTIILMCMAHLGVVIQCKPNRLNQTWRKLRDMSIDLS